MMLENIVRHREMGQSKRAAALNGANEITFAAMAATIAVVRDLPARRFHARRDRPLLPAIRHHGHGRGPALAARGPDADADALLALPPGRPSPQGAGRRSSNRFFALARRTLHSGSSVCSCTTAGKPLRSRCVLFARKLLARQARAVRNDARAGPVADAPALQTAGRTRRCP